MGVLATECKLAQGENTGGVGRQGHVNGTKLQAASVINEVQTKEKRMQRGEERAVDCRAVGEDLLMKREPWSRKVEL